MSYLYSVLFTFLGMFCHQMPERSWILFGVQAPLCIRCCAISLGALLAAGYIFSRYPLPGWRLSFLLASPLVLDVATQLLGLHGGTNSLRFATGLGFGFFFLIGSLKWLAARPCRGELAAASGERAILRSMTSLARTSSPS